jgi:hypothetical protein
MQSIRNGEAGCYLLRVVLVSVLSIASIFIQIDKPSAYKYPGFYPSQYEGDWAKMNLGLSSDWHHPVESSFQKVIGEEVRITISDKQSVKLEHIALKIKWQGKYDKYGTTYIFIKNCHEVNIDDVHVVQLDPDYRASCSIRIEDCDLVKVKNSSFHGTCQSHLRIEGCREVIVDSIEIAGEDYGRAGVRCGAGIFLNNGEDGPGKYPNNPTGFFSPTPRIFRTLLFPIVLSTTILPRMNIEITMESWSTQLRTA